MRITLFHICFIALAMWLPVTRTEAQDTRTQYPRVLARAYFGVEIGYIDYAFSQQQLEPGYQAESVQIPHTAVRITLLGYRINDYLSAQITYMRPIKWVAYKNINGSISSHELAMNVAGLTARATLPVSAKLKLGADAGIGIITRGGFIVDNEIGVRDASYAGILMGSELSYMLNKNWGFTAGLTWSPAHEKENQPATIFYALGVEYRLQPLSPDIVKRNAEAGYHFPRQAIQVGFTTNGWGYGVNDFVSKGAIPVFWGGEVQVEKAFAVDYHRNLFHTRKVFSLDWGAEIGYWKSRKNGETFYTASIFPVFRFTALRLKPADLYFYYSVAGPTFISRPVIDDKMTGKKFTFRDAMGIGLFAGKQRHLNAEIRIAHFSNGNIFPQNNGVMVPLTFALGYAFH